MISFKAALVTQQASLVVQLIKNPPANAGDTRDVGSIPGLGKSLGEGNGSPLQYSCLENPMDRGALWATVHEVATSRTRLSTHTLVTRQVGHFIGWSWAPWLLMTTFGFPFSRSAGRGGCSPVWEAVTSGDQRKGGQMSLACLSRDALPIPWGLHLGRSKGGCQAVA